MLKCYKWVCINVISQKPANVYNDQMQLLLFFVVSSLLASFVAIDQFVAEYRFAMVVLAVYPVVMFHWTAWFLRTLRELRG